MTNIQFSQSTPNKHFAFFWLTTSLACRLIPVLKSYKNWIFNITLTILLQIKSQLIINISPCLKYSYLYLISFEIS